MTKTKRLVLKMAISAITIALCIILMKFGMIAIPSLLPYARISLGPSLIIFASIYLGPFFGMLVGAASDLIGFLFDNTGYGFFPGITIMYALLGFASYFVFKLVQSIKQKNSAILAFIGVLGSVLIIAIMNVLKTDVITLGTTVYDFTFTYKAIIISVILLMSILMIVAVSLIHIKRSKTNKNDFSVIQISTTCMIVEIFIIMFFGAAVKSFHFGMSFQVTVFTQLILFFINVPLNTIIVSVLYNLLRGKTLFTIKDKNVKEDTSSN